VLFWGWTARSLLDLVTTLHELMALAVGFVSLSEALDVTTPSGRAIQRCEGDATTRYTKD
jgi:DNA invertase Pin-like site-specific DNA recombinase